MELSSVPSTYIPITINTFAMKKDSAILVVGGHLKSKKEVKMYRHEKKKKRKILKSFSLCFPLTPDMKYSIPVDRRNDGNSFYTPQNLLSA